MVARVSGFGFIVITQLFVGHLGELSLAAYAIQQTVFLRFTNGILEILLLHLLGCYSTCKRMDSKSDSIIRLRISKSPKTQCRLSFLLFASKMLDSPEKRCILDFPFQVRFSVYMPVR
ncbi:uncharacterized protein [Euphorbia lathyris]|uniref:uncharacterized protein isoform X3 n=1 Tax=Euphorbia lathyris TaxID=212925 RepID=UPI0033137E02